MNVLFVCSRNRIRSLTAERVFTGIDGWTVRSAGTQPDARVVVTEALVAKSDVILVMEKSHLARLRRRFGRMLDGKRIASLHIPDDYQYMQPELIDELIARVGEQLPLPPGFGSATD
jgi:predicted protein tyrosine phosphatase